MLFAVRVCRLFQHAQHSIAGRFGRHQTLADRARLRRRPPIGAVGQGFPAKIKAWNQEATNALAGIQIPGGAKYILAPGDVVTVTVWGHPELSGKRVIGPDGDIQLPFVGSFKVAGLQRRRCEQAGSRRLCARTTQHCGVGHCR